MSEQLFNSWANTGRLLYYFPKNEIPEHSKNNNSEINWCGWHRDHGTLTCLLPPSFINPKENINGD